MKFYTRVPFYLGLVVLVGSILTSAVTLGQRRNLTYQRSKAAAGEANLSLSFSPPNLVSVYVTGESEIAGVDVAIKYNSQEVSLLPSSLTAGPGFITSGAIINEGNDIFSFSALPNKTGITAAVVATFNAQVKGNSKKETNLRFVLEKEQTAIWEKASNNNILTNATGVKFKLIP